MKCSEMGTTFPPPDQKNRDIDTHRTTTSIIDHAAKTGAIKMQKITR